MPGLILGVELGAAWRGVRLLQGEDLEECWLRGSLHYEEGETDEACTGLMGCVSLRKQVVQE